MLAADEMCSIQLEQRLTYTKVLNLMKNLVIQGKVVARNDVDAGIFLDLPVSKTQTLGLSEEIGL